MTFFVRPTSRWFIGVALVVAACGKDGDPPRPVVVVVDAGQVVPEVPKGKAVAALGSPTGPVTLERDGKTRAAKVEPLFGKDVIVTGREATAELRFGGDRVVELTPEGRFELVEERGGVSLNVIEGGVLTRMSPGKAATPEPEGGLLLSISTPFGLTRLGSAEVGVQLKDGGAELNVTLGVIEMVSLTGEVTKAGPGTRVLQRSLGDLPDVVLGVISTGKAELKANGTKTFVLINPKKPPTLSAGDTVRVREGRFSVAPEGSATRVSLLKGAEATIGKVAKGPWGEATGLEVTKGDLEVVAPQGQVTRVGVASGITLLSEQGGQFNVRRTGSGFDIEALAGDVTIEREGGEKATVKGGESATIPLKGAASVRPATREPVAVTSRNVKIFHTGLRKMTVGWDEEGAKAWRFQLATESSFKEPVRDGVVHEPFVAVPALPKGTWFWRVLDGTKELSRGQVTFAPEAKTVDLTRVSNEVPAARETTTIHFQDKDKPPMVTFTWTAEEGASKYSVRVYREGQFSSTVAERTVSELQASLPENTLAEGKYSWSVTPLDAKGAELKGGKMKKLEMRFDNGAAALNIKTPRNGDVAGKTVKTSGVVPVGTRLFVNGKAIDLDDQGRFDATVVPQGGRLIYRHLGNGPETLTIRTVRGK